MLKIGVLGHNTRIGRRALLEIAKNDIAIINRQDIARGIVQMDDGTIYEIINFSGYGFRGKRYDQIIYADDDRWEIFRHFLNLDCNIFKELQHMMMHSCVPEKFQYIKYELE